MVEEQINPNAVTHEVDVGGNKRLIIADDLQAGYKDEVSFASLTEDAVGEMTGDNRLAVKAGEEARETHNTRADLVIANLARRQRMNKGAPDFKIWTREDGDAIMVCCVWDNEKECQVAIVAHCWEGANGEPDHRILFTKEVRV